MSAARDRIPPVRPSNQPTPRPARPDPDEAATPAAAPPPRQAPPPLLPARVPDMSVPPSRLDSFLGESDTAAGAEPSIPLSALIGTRRVDPDLDLTQLNTQVPVYFAEALRAMAHVDRARKQDIVREGLRRVIPPRLLEECRRAEEAKNR